jgi:hypothetical protein
VQARTGLSESVFHQPSQVTPLLARKSSNHVLSQELGRQHLRRPVRRIARTAGLT